MHGTISLHEEGGVRGLVAEIEVPRLAIIGNGIRLYPVPQPLELPTSGLIFRLPLHLAGLLVIQETLSQHPCLLPDVMQPTKELVDLEVRALTFWRGQHHGILGRKEMPESPVLLLPASAHHRRNPVLAVGRLVDLALHLLGQL